MEGNVTIQIYVGEILLGHVGWKVVGGRKNKINYVCV